MNNPQEICSPLNQYSMLKVIGKGSYAKVILVRKKSNGCLYALKSMKKKYIEKKKQEKRVLLQKQILLQIKHPFLVGMIGSFQTDTKLFLVLEYCPGGELFGLLEKKKRFTEQQAKFYIAQILIAIEYLHSKNIIYRDLKPENVLIDSVGYIKLTDFGLSKNNIVGDKDTFSVCGTPQYLPPEVIKKEGHGKAVDYWCLGSLLYELLYGMPPFYCNNRNELFERIKTKNPYFPNHWSKDVRNLLIMLFEKDPTVRISYIQKLKQHPWFASINWEKLMLKQCTPPFIPKIENEEDVQNFSHQFTEIEVSSPIDAGDGSFHGKRLQGFSFSESPGAIKEQTEMEEEHQGNFQFEMEIEKE